MHAGRFGVLAISAFTMLVSLPVAAAAQSIPSPIGPASLALAEPAAGTALKRSYRITLRSAWPQWGAAGSSCVNGGAETLVGTLTADGEVGYEGTFTRRTRLLFCGAHGAPAADRCDVTLEGEGEVAVSATVLNEEASPSGRVARLIWIPDSGHTVTVTGTCSDSFKNAIQAMYLNARHSVEVPLTTVGSHALRRRLDDYPWTVEVE